MGACYSRAHKNPDNSCSNHPPTEEGQLSHLVPGMPMEDNAVFQRALAIIKSAHAVPSLIVCDLDYTIWPCYCECETTAPRPYPDITEILTACKYTGIRLAVASRCPTPELAKGFLLALGLLQFFEHTTIYPCTKGSNKNAHFQELTCVTGVNLQEMLLFDDELDNIRAAGLQGTCAVHCEEGVTLELFNQGITMFAMRNSSQ